jgi:hypothetical protein
VRHILAKRLEEFRAAFAQLPEGTDRAGAALDILWQKLSGKVFYAWLELVVASRTDPALHQAVVEIAGQFLDQVQATTREIFRARSDALFPLDMAPALAFAAMQGLALDRIMWPSDDGRLDEALRTLRSLAAVALRTHDAPKSSANLGR